MTTFAQPPSFVAQTDYFGPARVVESGDTADTVHVVLMMRPEAGQVPARIATHSPDPLKEGDRVLVAGDEADDLYVIGILNRRPMEGAGHGGETFKHDSRGKVEAGGAYAVTDDSDLAPTLRVFSRQGELVFEYDPDTGRARVHIQNGDLELLAPQGDMAVRCNGALRFRCQADRDECPWRIRGAGG